MKKFKNTPNKCVWISRANAIVSVVILSQGDKNYVLLGKRGKGTPDFQGHWNIPCGYLDWDESGTQAAYRELYEETGLDLEALMQNDIEVLQSNLKQPWHVNHYATSNKQNVTLNFGVKLKYPMNLSLPVLTTEFCEPDEVDDVNWVEISDALKLELAFNHNKLLINYLNFNRSTDD